MRAGFGSVADLTVSASYVGAFCDYLGRRGVPSRLVRRMLASDADVDHPFNRVPHDQVWTLFESWAAELENRHLGLGFGSAVGGAGFGLLGVAAATADSLGEAIRTLVTTEPIVSSVGRAFVRADGDRVQLGWREHHLPNTYGSALFTDAVLAGWVSFARFMAGWNLPVQHVTLAHRPAGARATYEDVFGAPVETGAPENLIEFTRELLPIAPRYANPELHRTMLGWCRDCSTLAALGGASKLRRAADAIARRCGQAAVSLDDVAPDVDSPRRTLQRHLARDGLSFRRLLECIRVTVAVSELLRDQQPILAIGEHTGFAEQASFSRTFRKWIGVSPSGFRRLFPREYAALRDQ
jgi:AraC-like DNA-binding protein